MNEPTSEQSIFLQAIALDSPAERASYLVAACRNKPEMRIELDALLAAHDRLGGGPPPAGAYLPAPEAADAGRPLPPSSPEAPGTVIGPYKLIERIGEGGMGMVWMAQQHEPVKRLVAVKLVKAGMDTKQVVARFEAERQALALMDHPNIAKVLDGGATLSGRPYFVMELVKGVPIARYCDEHRLTLRQRLELFVPVCQAIQHAHQKGIIHRDLKPSNMLVALYDGKPVPKVIDFGVAKAVGQPLTEKTLVTGFGAIVGTLEYLSPEQAELTQLDIDTRSDVYSLGVLLYELLTGGPPFSRQQREEAGLLEMLKVIREEEPSKPSTKLSTADGLPALAANRGTEPAKLTRLVRGELDWIVMKALEKDRNHRYETANGLAHDIARYLADEPVLACPPSAAYRFQKFARRNKTVLATAAVVAAALVLGTAVSTWQAIRATRAEGLAEARLEAETKAHQDADTQRTFAQEHAAAAESRRKDAEAARQEAVANLQTALGAVDQLLSQVAQVDLAKVPRMEPIRRALFEKALKFYEGFLLKHGADRSIRKETSDAYYRMGSMYALLGQHVQAEKAFREAITLREQLATEFPGEATYRADLGWSYHALGGALGYLGRPREAEKALWQSLELWQALAAQYPAATGYRRWLALVQGELVVSEPPGRRTEEKALRQTLLLLEAQARDDPGGRNRLILAGSYVQMGRLLSGTGQSKEAERFFRQAVELQRELTTEFPENPEFQYALAYSQQNLGNLLGSIGRPQEEERLYRESIAIRVKLVDDFPQTPQYRAGLAATYLDLFLLLRRSRRFEEAEQVYLLSLEHAQKLVAEAPRRASYWRLLLRHFKEYGYLQAEVGRPQEAEKAYHETLAIGRKLLADFPAERGVREEMANTYVKLARLRRDTGQRPEAEAALRHALEFYEKIVAATPTATMYREAVAQTHLELAALASADPHRLEEAAKHHRQEVALRKKLAADFPIEPRYRQQLGDSRRGWGWQLWHAGRLPEAEQAFREAREHYEKRLQLSPKDPKAHNTLAWMLATVPVPELRDAARGVELAQKAVELTPDKGISWRTLGVAQYRSGAFKAAIDALMKSVQLHKEGDGFDLFFLAMAHGQVNEKDKARACYDCAVAWMEQHRPQDKELNHFRAEAAALLGLAKAADAPNKKK